MKQESANTFEDGLVMDLNPISTPESALTGCLNGTFLTYNGNELILQNDRGNYKLEHSELSENYMPVGMASYGDIMYIVSHNPFTNTTEIGSYPSPGDTIEIDDDESQDIPSILTCKETNGDSEQDPMKLIEKYQKLTIFFNGNENNILSPGDSFKFEFNKDSDEAKIPDFEYREWFLVDSQNNTIKISEEELLSPDDTYTKFKWKTSGYLAYQWTLPTIYDITYKVGNIIKPSFYIGDDRKAHLSRNTLQFNIAITFKSTFKDFPTNRLEWWHHSYIYYRGNNTLIQEDWIKQLNQTCVKNGNEYIYTVHLSITCPIEVGDQPSIEKIVVPYYGGETISISLVGLGLRGVVTWYKDDDQEPCEKLRYIDTTDDWIDIPINELVQKQEIIFGENTFKYEFTPDSKTLTFTVDIQNFDQAEYKLKEINLKNYQNLINGEEGTSYFEPSIATGATDYTISISEVPADLYIATFVFNEINDSEEGSESPQESDYSTISTFVIASSAMNNLNYDRYCDIPVEEWANKLLTKLQNDLTDDDFKNFTCQLNNLEVAGDIGEYFKPNENQAESLKLTESISGIQTVPIKGDVVGQAHLVKSEGKFDELESLTWSVDEYVNMTDKWENKATVEVSTNSGYFINSTFHPDTFYDRGNVWITYNNKIKKNGVVAMTAHCNGKSFVVNRKEEPNNQWIEEFKNSIMKDKQALIICIPVFSYFSSNAPESAGRYIRMKLDGVQDFTAPSGDNCVYCFLCVRCKDNINNLIFIPLFKEGDIYLEYMSEILNKHNTKSFREQKMNAVKNNIEFICSEDLLTNYISSVGTPKFENSILNFPFVLSKINIKLYDTFILTEGTFNINFLDSFKNQCSSNFDYCLKINDFLNLNYFGNSTINAAPLITKLEDNLSNNVQLCSNAWLPIAQRGKVVRYPHFKNTSHADYAKITDSDSSWNCFEWQNETLVYRGTSNKKLAKFSLFGGVDFSKELCSFILENKWDDPEDFISLTEVKLEENEKYLVFHYGTYTYHHIHTTLPVGAQLYFGDNVVPTAEVQRDPDNFGYNLLSREIRVSPITYKKPKECGIYEDDYYQEKMNAKNVQYYY